MPAQLALAARDKLDCGIAKPNVNLCCAEPSTTLTRASTRRSGTGEKARARRGAGDGRLSTADRGGAGLRGDAVQRAADRAGTGTGAAPVQLLPALGELPQLRLRQRRPAADAGRRPRLGVPRQGAAGARGAERVPQGPDPGGGDQPQPPRMVALDPQLAEPAVRRLPAVRALLPLPGDRQAPGPRGGLPGVRRRAPGHAVLRLRAGGPGRPAGAPHHPGRGAAGDGLRDLPGAAGRGGRQDGVEPAPPAGTSCGSCSSRSRRWC
jgi:hypothetical protein